MAIRLSEDTLRTCIVEEEEEGDLMQNSQPYLGQSSANFPESWSLIYEKIRFSDDNINVRPLVVQQTICNEQD